MDKRQAFSVGSLVLWLAATGTVVQMIARPVRAAAAQGQESFAEYKKKALASYDGKFNQICQSHAEDSSTQSFRNRLALVDEVAKLLVARFEATRKASLKGLLAEVNSPDKGPKKADSTARGMNAREIITEYQDRFAASLPRPALNEDELKTLRGYYDASARAAGFFIIEKGKFIEAVSKEEATDLLELCAVIPMLHVDDQNWTAADIEAFAAWMKKPVNLAALETFALRMRRPQTAYQFALYAANCGDDKAPAKLLYADYLNKAAERMIKAKDYYAGIHCLKVGILKAEAEKDTAATESLYFQLADVLGKTEHQQLAAEELRACMDGHPESTAWGKAAMLRLKFLYESAQFKKVIEDSGKFRTDQRCGGYLPQILYITWVSQRRENHAEEAEKLQKEFLEKFPTHQLGADMYFASAMTAMAAGNYEETLRLLEIVQYRYPSSRLQAKVTEIRDRLNKSLSDNKGGNK